MFMQLLPIIILFLFPIITNLFSAAFGPETTSSQPKMATAPRMVFDEADPEGPRPGQRLADWLDGEERRGPAYVARRRLRLNLRPPGGLPSCAIA